MGLTDRQQRELEYHREHAEQHRALLHERVNFTVITSEQRRWWNAHWEMYAILKEQPLGRVLVLGCGFGDDALYLAKMGAEVYAIDLSPESLQIAAGRVQREGLSVTFAEAPAECLPYTDNFFDTIVARDILHHVDIAQCLAEVRRVARKHARMVVNEIYSHSWTDTIRHSTVVERVLYPLMVHIIYGPGKPYITQDERKLNERDLKQMHLEITHEKHFNFIVTRLVPDRFPTAAKLDRVALTALKPFGRVFAGRVLIAGRLVN